MKRLPIVLLVGIVLCGCTATSGTQKYFLKDDVVDVLTIEDSEILQSYINDCVEWIDVSNEIDGSIKWENVPIVKKKLVYDKSDVLNMIYNGETVSTEAALILLQADSFYIAMDVVFSHIELACIGQGKQLTNGVVVQVSQDEWNELVRIVNTRIDDLCISNE